MEMMWTDLLTHSEAHSNLIDAQGSPLAEKKYGSHKTLCDSDRRVKNTSFRLSFHRVAIKTVSFSSGMY